ncbi:olfactory receptor 50-like [Lytechinus variegatus]|nr:olfactory receptor 50-like [Lytechinus variegatus]
MVDGMTQNESSSNEALEWPLVQDDDSVFLSTLDIFEVTILGVCLLLIVTTSTFIIIILHKVKDCFENVQQLMFKSLAFTDLLTGLFCCGLTMTGMIFRMERTLSHVMCAVGWAACTGLTGLSALLITCACIDRFIAVVYPLRYCSLVTMKRIRITLAITSLIVIANAALSTLRGGFAGTNLCLSDFSSEKLAFRPCLVPSLLITSTSLIVATVTNIKVMCVSSGQASRMTVTTPSCTKNDVENKINVIRQRQDHRKGLLVLVATTVTFFISLSPCFIISASHFNRRTAVTKPLARYVSTILMFSNSWMNAFIFSIFNKRFRDAAKKVVCRRLLKRYSWRYQSRITFVPPQ